MIIKFLKRIASFFSSLFTTKPKPTPQAEKHAPGPQQDCKKNTPSKQPSYYQPTKSVVNSIHFTPEKGTTFQRYRITFFPDQPKKAYGSNPRPSRGLK